MATAAPSGHCCGSACALGPRHPFRRYRVAEFLDTRPRPREGLGLWWIEMTRFWRAGPRGE
jgi:hypothetical protein